MARTTRVANKKSTTSKNSSTAKSKGLFGKSFDLKSRKVQFFVVILIVAILGGGYYTIKSFAGTTISTSNVGNNGLRCGTGCSIVPDAKKNNIQVLRLEFKDSTATSLNIFNGAKAPSRMSQVCITASSGGSILTVKVTDRRTGSRLIDGDRISIVGEYKAYCLKPIMTNNTERGLSVEIAVSGIKTGNTTKISAVQVNSIPFPTQPAPVAPVK